MVLGVSTIARRRLNGKAAADRGWDAIVIGSTSGRSTGISTRRWRRCSSTRASSCGCGRQAAPPAGSEDDEQLMLALGLQSKQEITRIRVRTAMAAGEHPRHHGRGRRVRLEPVRGGLWGVRLVRVRPASASWYPYGGRPPRYRPCSLVWVALVVSAVSMRCSRRRVERAATRKTEQQSWPRCEWRCQARTPPGSPDEVHPCRPRSERSRSAVWRRLSKAPVAGRTRPPGSDRG